MMRILSDTMLWVIPSLNPDTYDSNLQSSSSNAHRLRKKNGLHRKNMKETCQVVSRYRSSLPLILTHSTTTESGVDLNRNFPVCFDVDEVGSSGRSCSDIYRVRFSLQIQFVGPLSAFRTGDDGIRALPSLPKAAPHLRSLSPLLRPVGAPPLFLQIAGTDTECIIPPLLPTRHQAHPSLHLRRLHHRTGVEGARLVHGEWRRCGLLVAQRGNSRHQRGTPSLLSPAF